MPKNTINIYAITTLIAILVIWEGLFRVFKIPEYLYPLPSKVVNIIWSDPTLLDNAFITFLEVIGGFALGSMVGFLIACLFSFSKKIERALLPYAILIQVTPVIAIAPLIILWFGNGMIAKIIIAAIISFFPVMVNSYRGLTSVDQDYLKLFKILGASRFQVFTELKIPTSLPYLFSALKIASSMATVGAVVGEFVSANKGLGYYILINSYQLKTNNTFAGIVLAALIGWLFYTFITVLDRKIIFWIRQD